jgi:hypothetical protein
MIEREYSSEQMRTNYLAVVRQTLFFAEKCVSRRRNYGECICGGFVIVYLPPIRNVQSESRSKF